MASSLQELRKMAGFKTAKEFAAKMEIPLPTYSRYECSPDKIPLQSAWALADHFRVPIDVIVGRDGSDVNAIRGGVQHMYDSLSPAARAAFDEYLSFLVKKDSDARRRAQEEEHQRYDALCRRYEHLYLARLEADAEFGELTDLGTPAEQRAGFQAFVEAMAAEKRAGKPDEGERAERDAATVERLMQAWDRAHGASE